MLRTGSALAVLSSLVAMMVAGSVGAGGRSSARATPGSGTTGMILARGTMPKAFKIKTRRASDIVVQQVSIQPGGSTGWHTHPANVLATVTSGTLTSYERDCTFHAYHPGDSFIETDEVHNGRNTGTEPVELYVTYIAPHGGALRVEAADPGCGF